MRTVGSRELRYSVSLLLREVGRPMTIPKLVTVVEASGFRITGRASKTLSDALRWELRRGRVTRVGRGRYSAGSMPRSTASWMRTFLAQRTSAAPHP